MPLQIDVKSSDGVHSIASLTQAGLKVKLATKNKTVTDNILVDVVHGGVDTSDATANASKILNGYTAYIADESKATGTIQTWNGELAQAIVSPTDLTDLGVAWEVIS